MPAGIEPWWHACGIMLVVSLYAIRRWASSTNIVVICLVALPGVALHETSHLILGLVFRARPCGFNLIPERNHHGGWTLGSVEFGRVTALNAVPIALAPLLLLALAYGLFSVWPSLFPSPTLLTTLWLYAAMFVLSYESIPSRQDIRVACNWKSVLLYGSAIGAVVAWKYCA